ncbi:MAG: MOSC domain-containing protein [Pseudomonadota bacterium]
MQGRVAELYTYPIKGMSARPLETVELQAHHGFPADRLFGFAKANGGFDPQNPKPLPKTSFVVLMEHARLAGLKTDFDAPSGTLSVDFEGQTLRFELSEDIGKDQASHFLSGLLGLPAQEQPQFVEGSPHRFTDVSVVSETMMNAVSLINLDSVEDLADRIGEPVDPMRFRANIYFRGWPAMSELDLVGQRLRIGPVVMKVLLRTQRCAATEVNPQTAERDLRIPFLLRKHYGHFDMGIYAEVVQGGRIEPGDRISTVTDRQDQSVADLF